MKLQEFLEKFLPDYEAKWERFTGGKIPRGIIPLNDLHYKFQCDFFPEALQNFLDKACEIQRENCMDYFVCNMGIDYDDFSFIDMREVEQPKIEEL